MTARGGAIAEPEPGRPLTVAERVRRHRARRRAELAERRAEEARAPLRLLLERQAAADLDRIGQHLTPEQAALPPLERAVEGARALVLRLYGHPLLRLAETANAPPELLAELLECSRLEAARLAQEAQRELLDRLFGRPAQAKGDGSAPAVAVHLTVSPEAARSLNIQGVSAEEPA